MPAPGAIRAGQAFVELFADDSRLVAGLRAAQARLSAFASRVRELGLQLGGVGAAILAPVLAATRQFVATGDQFDKMARRTGISVEALSAFAVAADSSGTSIEAVEGGVRVLQRTLAAAARGSQTATDAIHGLGLSVEALSGLSPEQQFLAVAAAISRIPDPTTRAAAAMRVFGRSGTSLIPLLQDLPELRAEAERLGQTMSTEQAHAAAELSDAMDRVHASIRATSASIGSALAPLLGRVSDRIVAFLIGARTWVDQNQALVVSLTELAAKLVAIGSGLIALSVAAKGMAFVVGGVRTLLSGLLSVLGLLGTALGALTTPIGLVIGATLALGIATVVASRSGISSLTDLGQQFSALREEATAAWQGIADALAAGDIALAAKILWLTLKLEWQRGIGVLRALWADATTALAITLAKAWFGLQELWAKVVGALGRIWTAFTSTLLNAWTRTEAFIAKGMAKLAGLFDRSFDVQAVTRSIDQEVLQRTTETDQGRDQQRTESQQRVQEIEAQRASVLQDLGDQNVERQAAIEQDLAAARSEFQQAIAQARSQRSAVDERVHPTAPSPAPALPDLDAIAAALDRTAQKLDVTGTFNVAAVAELGVGGTAAERTAKATEATATNTAKILRELSDNELAFE